jgi:hypothetical protein
MRTSHIARASDRIDSEPRGTDPDSNVRVWMLIVLAALLECTPTQTSETQQASVVQLGSFGFGNVPVGTQSAPYTITVQPASGDQLDTITSIALSCAGGNAPFALANLPALPATVSSMCIAMSYGYCDNWQITTQSFQTYFQPTIPNRLETCTVYVTLDNQTPSSTCDDAMHQCVTLSGTGYEPAVAVAAPTSLAFGTIPVGHTSSALPLVFVNSGSDSAGANVTDASASPLVFGVFDGSNRIPYNGGSDAYRVTCTPTGSGAVAGDFTLKVAQLSTAVTVPLSCTGVFTNLYIDNNPTIFGGNQTSGCVRVGDYVDVPITLENGSANPNPMAIESLAFAGSNATDVALAPGAQNPTGTLITPGGMTITTLRYAPTAPTGGDNAQLMSVGQVLVGHDGSADVLSLAGCAVGASFSVLPADSIDFGPVCVGATAMQMLQIVTADYGTFDVTGVSMPAAPFALGGVLPTPGNPIAITGNTSVEPITASVAPTDVGAQTGAFDVSTDVNTGSGMLARTVALRVTGLPPGTSATPETVDFGAISVDATSIVQTLTISNCSSDPLDLGDATIEGPDAAAFSIVVPPASASIGPTDSVSYGLVLQPKHIGSNNATLDIMAGSDMVKVPLVGTGGNGAGVSFSGATYYTCAAGGAAGWPIALALLGVRRRRRLRARA